MAEAAEMIHALISLAIFIIGLVIGSHFDRQSARMEGFDEGFRAGKESARLQCKIELNTLYGKFSDGRKE